MRPSTAGVTRADLPNRRPLFVLRGWLNTIIARPVESHDLHRVFADGLTLCHLLERLRPGVGLVRFGRPVTRGTMLANIEAALSLLWSLSPQAAGMPSASQVLDGSPRDLLLRFVDQLYSIFVVRPARGRLGASARWLEGLLAPYQLGLLASTIQPPHATMGNDLRSGAALAILLHECLPERRSGLDGAVYWRPRTEAERQRSLEAVFSVLQRERLAPCTALEILTAARPPAATVPRGGLSPQPQQPPAPVPFSELTNGVWHTHGTPGGGQRLGAASSAHHHSAERTGALGGEADHEPSPWSSSKAPYSEFAPAGPSGGPSGGAPLECELLGIVLAAVLAALSKPAPPGFSAAALLPALLPLTERPGDRDSPLNSASSASRAA